MGHIEIVLVSLVQLVAVKKNTRVIFTVSSLFQERQSFAYPRSQRTTTWYDGSHICAAHGINPGADGAAKNRLHWVSASRVRSSAKPTRHGRARELMRPGVLCRQIKRRNNNTRSTGPGHLRGGRDKTTDTSTTKSKRQRILILVVCTVNTKVES